MIPAFSIIFCEKDAIFVRIAERLRLRSLLDFEADSERPRPLDERLFEDLAPLQVRSVMLRSVSILPRIK